MHEWRPLLGQMLRELVASGGMKPQGGGSKNPPPDLRDNEHWGPLEMDNPEGWVWSHVLCPNNTANSPASSAVAGLPRKVTRRMV
jgi:hypothetical protein